MAKGACIILVVLGHTVEWYGRAFLGREPELWFVVLYGMRPLRMPLFFMISGILAARTIHKPFRDLWSKTGGLYILYCLWTAVYCLKLALPGGRDALPYPSLAQIAGAMALPALLWYIWALPAFYTLAWCLERWFGRNSVYALVPMLGLAIAAPAIGRATAHLLGTPLFMIQSQSVLGNLIWFYLGLKGRAFILTLADRSTPPRLAIATVLGIAAMGLMRFDHDGELVILAAPFMLWASLQWLGKVRDDTGALRPLAVVGRRTLPVYVLHTFVLTGLTPAVRAVGVADRVPMASPVLQFAVPLLVTFLIVPACIFAGRCFERVGLGFLTAPAPLPSRARHKSEAPAPIVDSSTLASAPSPLSSELAEHPLARRDR